MRLYFDYSHLVVGLDEPAKPRLEVVLKTTHFCYLGLGLKLVKVDVSDSETDPKYKPEPFKSS